MAVTVKTFDEVSGAAQALSSDQSAIYLGGGTLVMRGVNDGDLSISTMVRSTDDALRQIRVEGDRLRLGAGVTMSQIAASGDAGFLASAARTVGGPAIRNMATVGGNLFAHSPFGDLTTALLALDATVITVGGMGGQEQALEEFLRNRGRSPKPLVTAVKIRRPQGQSAFRFHKVSRVKPKGAAVISIAAHLPTSGGRLSGVAIAYGAMAETPVRVPAVEKALEGKTLDATGIASALAAAVDGISPPTDAIATQWYRQEVAPVYLKRLLLGEIG